MKIIKTKVYEFSELTDAAKQKARDWYREVSAADTDWHESTTDDAKACLKFLGWDITQIYFSGFSSQGDGACFEGSWRAEDVNAAGMLEHAPQDTELNRLAEAFKKIAANHLEATAGVKHSGHYYHEYCTAFDVDIPDNALENLDYGSSEYKTREAILQDVEKEIIELSRDAMRWIYRQLEKAYEFENSDETVDANILANGYTFMDTGRRFG
jgi:hypothetical protein